MKDKVSGSNYADPMGLSKMFDMKEIKDQKLEPYQDSIDKIEDSIKISGRKAVDLINIQSKLSSVQKNLSALSDLSSNIFNQRSAIFTTSTDGEYINVGASIGSQIRNVTIKDIKMPVKASLDVYLNYPGSGNYSDYKGVPANWTCTGNQSVRIRYGAGDTDSSSHFFQGRRTNLLTFNMPSGSTLDQMITILNQQLPTKGMIARKISVQGDAASSNSSEPYIMNSSNPAGYTIRIDAIDCIPGSEIGIDLYSSSGSGSINAFNYNANATRNIDGRYGSVTVDDVIYPVIQTDNIQAGDLTLSIKKPITGSLSPIKIDYDKTAFGDAVTKFIDSVGEYQKNYAIIKNKKDEEGSDISTSSSSLNEANRLINSFLSTVQNPSDSNSYSLKNLGIGWTEEPATSTTPGYKKIEIVDLTTFSNIINNNFSLIPQILRNNSVITNVGNPTSSLTSVGVIGALDNSVMNQTLSLNVVIGGNSTNITTTVTIPGVPPKIISGTFSNGNITFTDPLLSSVVLNYDPKTALNRTDQFTFKIIPGIGDILSNNINSITNKSGNGSLDIEIKAELNNSEKLEKRQKEAKAKFDQISEKYDKTDKELMILNMQFKVTDLYFNELAAAAA